MFTILLPTCSCPGDEEPARTGVVDAVILEADTASDDTAVPVPGDGVVGDYTIEVEDNGVTCVTQALFTGSLLFGSEACPDCSYSWDLAGGDTVTGDGCLAATDASIFDTIRLGWAPDLYGSPSMMYSYNYGWYALVWTGVATYGTEKTTFYAGDTYNGYYVYSLGITIEGTAENYPQL